MSVDLTDREVKSGKGSSADPEKAQTSEPVRIAAASEGGWLPAEDLKQAALKASGQGRNVMISLDGIGHLDAGALQVLLALHAEQRQGGRSLELTDASPELCQWFDYSGASAQLAVTGKSDE